jgi:uncharacterized membrane protein YcaP (DUF421 family)
MYSEWLSSAPTALVMVVVSTVGIYIVILLLTRLNGLQSFSKMSSFDFAITVAIGSVIASTIVMEEPSLGQGATGLAALFALQFAISWLRRQSDGARRLLDNAPLLVVARGQILHENLARSRMSTHDLYGKMRSNGICRLEDVFAVVFETTGDVSVISAGSRVDRQVFSGVRGADLLWPSDDAQ